VSLLQPYSSKEEAQSAGPDSWAGHAANSGITALLSKSNAVNPSAWTTCRALAAPRPRRSECHPRRIAGVAARQGLLLHADSHYVDPVSSRQRVPAPTGLAEHAYTNMHIQQWDLRVIPAACCAPAAFKRSAMHQARLERVELRQADRLAARAELGQLQDHYHQNDNDQDADNDPNDSTVHFSSFRFACGSDLWYQHHVERAPRSGEHLPQGEDPLHPQLNHPKGGCITPLGRLKSSYGAPGDDACHHRAGHDCVG